MIADNVLVIIPDEGDLMQASNAPSPISTGTNPEQASGGEQAQKNLPLLTQGEVVTNEWR